MEVRRGDVVTVATQGDFGKPRPAVVVQANLFAEHSTLTVCPISSMLTGAHLFRVPLAPDAANGLRLPSEAMVDKLQTVKREKVGARVGVLADEPLQAVDRALRLWLGL